MSCYLHKVPGRVRIKTPIFKGEPHLARVVEAKLRMLSGICSVTINSLAGSILINYDHHEIESAAILCLVGKECGLDLSAAYPDMQKSENPSKTEEQVTLNEITLARSPGNRPHLRSLLREIAKSRTHSSCNNF